MKKSSLKKIDLRNKQIDEKTFETKTLPGLKTIKNLGSLDLTDNQLGDGGETDWGIRSLAEFLKTNHSIERLILKNNNIGSHGANWLLGALSENTSIIFLDISEQKANTEEAAITAKQLQKIEEALQKNMKLKEQHQAASPSSPSSLSKQSLVATKSTKSAEPRFDAPDQCCVIS